MIDSGTPSGMLHYAHLNACTKSDALVQKCTISKKCGHKPLHYEGFYMEHEASIEYFQVITDKENKPRDIGVAFKLKDTASYLVVNTDGSLSSGALSHGFDTVFSVSTDYQGYSLILTQIWQRNEDTGKYSSRVVALTLTGDDHQVTMEERVDDENLKTRQLWTVVCAGDVTYASENHLSSASFLIENVHTRTRFLNMTDNSVTVNVLPNVWTLSMEPMKPAHLVLRDIELNSTPVPPPLHIMGL